MAIQETNQIAKMAACKVFHYGDYFDAALATIHSYRYAANATEEFEKIATLEKDYRISSMSIIVCIITAYQ